MQDIAILKQKLLKDPEFKREYDALEPEYALAEQLIRKRLEKKLSQKQLADRVGTKQSAISRLESGAYNPSVAFLKRLAGALNTNLEIRFA